MLSQCLHSRRIHAHQNWRMLRVGLPKWFWSCALLCSLYYIPTQAGNAHINGQSVICPYLWQIGHWIVRQWGHMQRSSKRSRAIHAQCSFKASGVIIDAMPDFCIAASSSSKRSCSMSSWCGQLIKQTPRRCNHSRNHGSLCCHECTSRSPFETHHQWTHCRTR